MNIQNSLPSQDNLKGNDDMQTLDEPVYEVKQDSKWYQKEKKRREDMKKFFKTFKEKYGVVEGFAFYHSEYFGVYEDSEAYEVFKDEVRKPEKEGFCPFKKRSKNYQEIKEVIEQVEDRNPFKSHDVLGMNNMTASQWIGDRWFYGVKNPEMVKGDEVIPIDYKDYLKIVMEKLEE